MYAVFLFVLMCPQLSLSLLDTIVCYSTISLAALNHVIICLCEVISLEQYYERTWDVSGRLH